MKQRESFSKRSSSYSRKNYNNNGATTLQENGYHNVDDSMVTTTSSSSSSSSYSNGSHLNQNSYYNTLDNGSSSSSSGSSSIYANTGTPRKNKTLPRRKPNNPMISLFSTKKNDNSGGTGGCLTSIKVQLRTSEYIPLLIAIVLWYSLGVVSIATSKMLLSEPHQNHHHTRTNWAIPPMFLTLQQLLIGMCLLRLLLHLRFMNSPGLQPWPGQISPLSLFYKQRNKKTSIISKHSSRSRRGFRIPSYFRNLLLTGIYFSLGFLATNCAFHGSSAAFVETIKASEPISSAVIAVLWGIETLTPPEIASLCSIIFGVVLSIIGNRASSPEEPPGIISSSLSATAELQNSLLNNVNITAAERALLMENMVLNGDGMMDEADAMMMVTPSFVQAIQSCAIVLVANLCFSFRGLYQKLFRNLPEGNQQLIDDLNLQFRTQQIGFIMLFIPVLLWDIPQMIPYIYRFFFPHHTNIHADQYHHHNDHTGSYIMITLKHMALSIINGVAFTSYNLASTFILTRISVVHHAALNCMRRIFAIIMTSIIFLLPITMVGVIGFITSMAGFMSFTQHKLRKKERAIPVSSLLPVSTRME